MMEESAAAAAAMGGSAIGVDPLVSQIHHQITQNNTATYAAEPNHPQHQPSQIDEEQNQMDADAMIDEENHVSASK